MCFNEPILVRRLSLTGQRDAHLAETFSNHKRPRKQFGVHIDRWIGASKKTGSCFAQGRDWGRDSVNWGAAEERDPEFGWGQWP